MLCHAVSRCVARCSPQTQRELIASFKRHDINRGLMSKLNALEGPKRTYLRVILADVRFLIPLLLLWWLVMSLAIGNVPALAVLGAVAVVFAVWV